MSRQIVVVDDAIIIREMIKDAATEFGWEVVGEGDNGKTAVELCRKYQPAVMTLDLVMPEFDGLFALRQLQEECSPVKVIVCSALDQKSILRDAFSLGAADFIVKPFAKAALSEALTALAPVPA